MKEAPFYIGQKVVRVTNDSNGILKVGKDYTVSEIKYCCTIWGWRISLVGVDNHGHLGCECGKTGNPRWAAKNFRAVSENTYENISKELAVLPQDEVPDVKKIKELV